MSNNIPSTASKRIEWLKQPDNRNPICRGGAGAIYYQGDLSNVDTLRVIVSHRSKNVGQGLAHFGGLQEVEDIVQGAPVQTGINNACREAKEEMAELLGFEPDLNLENYTYLYAAKDDGFFIQNGKGFPVNARLHAYEMDNIVWTQLFPNNTTERGRDSTHEGYEETDKAEVLLFKEALKREADYFYPHEYFSLWVMAAKVMKCDLEKLITQVNGEMHPQKLNFERLAERMYTDLEALDKYLGGGYEEVLQKYQLKNFSEPENLKAINKGPKA